ncbi:hypothetical protein GCM10022197_35910 [Microlunatus spumicola]|uniref:DUF11 domain-containing protein n=1 Tax=Microlunatus spumicola TaxID=81499 RepID=A0ABP6Y2I1_9ACTN
MLSVQLGVAPATITRTGRTLTYTVTVRNTGNGALRDLAVSAVAPGLPTLVCAPVALGATLYTSTTTTCTATRTSTADDLRSAGQDVSASAAGFATDGTAVTASASARTAVATLAPRASDDTVTVLSNTGPVVLPGSTNDSPGETGGPAVDGSRTDLPPASGTGPATRSRATGHGTFLVLGDGSLRYAITPPGYDPYTSGWTDTVTYRTYDLAGKSSTAVATVVVRRPPVAAQDPVAIGGDQRGTVDPLANDRAGQRLDGTDASLDASSLRFTANPSGRGTTSADGLTRTVPNAGVFTLADGLVTFTQTFENVDPVSAQYAVTDTSGVTVTGSVVAAAFGGAPGPTVTHDVATTTFATPVQLPGVLDDSPAAPGSTVSFGGFIGSDHGTNLGNTVTTPRGTWSLVPDGHVLFTPAWGFTGAFVQYYLARDSGGGETVSALTAKVQPGPVARPDTLATRVGADGSTDPAANDTPGLRVDGTPGTFDPRWAVFPANGQPVGAVVSGNGKTLTLPGRGTLWFTNGTVVFRPQAGFRGFAGTVAYQVEDTSRPGAQRGIAVVGRLSVLVTSDALTATDDSATTVLNQPVVLAAATNDDPGSTTTALRPTFPAEGQPNGSTRSTDGLTLTVPGQGVWTATSTAAAVTFTPAVKYAGTTAPVTYEISGAGGATARASLQVGVAAGPVAVPDVATRLEGDPAADGSISVDLVLNDNPGRSADGRLGTIVAGSVLFPTTGQPTGATIGDGGRDLHVPASGSRPGFDVGSGTNSGLVVVRLDKSFHGTLPTIAYSVLSDVVDATGVSRRLYTRSTLQLTIVGGDIVTTDDHVTVRSGRTASVPGASNDNPAPGFFPFSFDEMSFSATGQPPGSQVVDEEHGHDHEYSLVVPDEGVWRINGGGYLSFKPDAGFVGTTSPVRYTIFDFAFLHFGEGAETVTVLPPAVPKADTAYTPQGVPVVVRTLANDTPELDPAGRPYDVTGTVAFDPARRPSGSTLTAGSGNTQLVVPGQGTYTVDQGTGDVRFVPDPTFRGSATAFYLTVPGGASRFQVILADVDPRLNADSATTTPGTSKRVRVLQNDQPGVPERPLVPGSVRMAPGPLTTPPSTTTADGQIAILPGRGLYAVAGDGNITFYPLAGVTGPAFTSYTVLDANGTKEFAGLSVRVS